jgi:dihydropteroate synthase
MFTFNLNGSLRTFKSPVVMGIINVNEDSFHAGSRAPSLGEALEKARAMLEQGADILDIGGQSTRPGSRRVSAEEEATRSVPVVQAIAREFPGVLLSVDTYHAEVAARAADSGASMVNDVSAGAMDPSMLPTVARLRIPYVCMHMQGTPENMQDSPSYSDVATEVFDLLAARLTACREAGIADVVIDPGFGFGKTLDHNFILLRRLRLFKALGVPLMVGLSRKSMVWRTLGVTPGEALNGSTVLHAFSLVMGADILRVHDVREAVEAVRLYERTFDADLPLSGQK